MQGGIHPEYTGDKYVSILEVVKQAVPEMHVHAFSPLEVWQGAATLDVDLVTYLERLKAAGLGTLPGTAAEILDDEVRATICPDKINTAQWLEVMEAAHNVGFKTTCDHHVRSCRAAEALGATHPARSRSAEENGRVHRVRAACLSCTWKHPCTSRAKRARAPRFVKPSSCTRWHGLRCIRTSPTFRRAGVKMGHEGIKACLNAGCNDLGGTLMNESISRAAGTQHGQETTPLEMRRLIKMMNRSSRQRSTAYANVTREREKAGERALELADIINTPAKKYERKRPASSLIKNQVVEVVDVTGG